MKEPEALLQVETCQIPSQAKRAGIMDKNSKTCFSFSARDACSLLLTYTLICDSESIQIELEYGKIVLHNLGQETYTKSYVCLDDH